MAGRTDARVAAHSVHRPNSTGFSRSDLLAGMKALAATLAILLALLGQASASSEYSLANRPVVAFPGSGGKHISPYPMSKRAAAVWTSDACWRDCTGQSAWRFESCLRDFGPEACRDRLDADDRICLRFCRTKGGPLLNITD